MSDACCPAGTHSHLRISEKRAKNLPQPQRRQAAAPAPARRLSGVLPRDSA